tara:strand:- start:2759 stop:2935 length:177 start_codon:yes stop_codon:yes gene_type:complete
MLLWVLMIGGMCLFVIGALVVNQGIDIVLDSLQGGCIMVCGVIAMALSTALAYEERSK